MPKIFELLGFHVDDSSGAARKSRAAARCPFMDSECDGGGNRYLSHIDLRKKPELAKLFPGRSVVASGVCSLQLREGERPWIVCPRRLLYLGKSGGGSQKHQGVSNSLFMDCAGFGAGISVGIWPELKIKFKQDTGNGLKSFDYTFDYIAVPVGVSSVGDIVAALGQDMKKTCSGLENAGYVLFKKGSELYVENFPIGSPVIVEIMTSSTSGGNKKKRTTIPMSFEDAALGKEHNGPGINYRQVWARMVSQLIVKSEVGLNWGGKTIWVLQDALVDYISASTALDINRFVAKNTSEVNILCLSYGSPFKRQSGVIEMASGQLFAGPIAASKERSVRPAFQDMIRAPICPTNERLLGLLARRIPTSVFRKIK